MEGSNRITATQKEATSSMIKNLEFLAALANELITDLQTTPFSADKILASTEQFLGMNGHFETQFRNSSANAYSTLKLGEMKSQS